jgi:hypothetical protein
LMSAPRPAVVSVTGRKTRNSRLQLDEGTEVGEASHPATDDLADGVLLRHRRPRIVSELFQSQRNLVFAAL